MPKETVLVADGDPRGLRMLSLALRRAGFAVQTAADGGQAIAALREGGSGRGLRRAAGAGRLEVYKAVRADQKPSASRGMRILSPPLDGSGQRRGAAIEPARTTTWSSRCCSRSGAARGTLDAAPLDPGARHRSRSVNDLGLMDVSSRWRPGRRMRS
jgi:CheY-like chemotaxis protein